MHSKQHFPNVIFGEGLRPQGAALAIMLMLLFLLFVLVFMTLIAQPVQAQTFTVLHNFTGGVDGANPNAGLTMDKAGNLYGTALFGGSSGCYGYGCGTVFKLTQKGSGWVFSPLYSFQGGNDGYWPDARVIIGPDGSLYGTTPDGGSGSNGTVFNLKPPVTACKTVLCSWTETVLYSFTGGSDGAIPRGDLVFDQAGNVYGTTQWGGAGGGAAWGTVYKMTHFQGTWTESVLYTFTNSPDDGGNPWSGVILDNAGNLYGTTTTDHYNSAGVVFELTPSGSGWVENALHWFTGGSDGKTPSGLIFDQLGNLYGTASRAGSDGGDLVFELTPSNGNWAFNVAYSFHDNCEGGGSLVMDATGNLYGRTSCGGAYGYGSVFKLTPSGGGWTYTSLHDFTNGSDGRWPSEPVLDSVGNLYGTAYAGGAYAYGTVWEIMP